MEAFGQIPIVLKVTERLLSKDVGGSPGLLSV